MRRISLLLLFTFLTVSFLQAQDEGTEADAPAEEAPVEQETAAEAPAEEASVEAPAEEASVEAPAEVETVAEVLAEAPAPSGGAGYTIGLDIGYPIMAGETFDYIGTSPVFAITVGTPYGMPLGPFDVGLNAGIGSMNGLTAAYAYASATVYNLPQGPITAFAGVGWIGGLGVTGGAAFDYNVPNMPIVVKPYARAVVAFAGGADGSSITGFASVGAMLSYAL